MDKIVHLPDNVVFFNPSYITKEELRNNTEEQLKDLCKFKGEATEVNLLDILKEYKKIK